MSSVRRMLYPGRQYLLRDDFNDDRAAGALNGTPASPGPGTRGDNDTQNKMSQSGGQLVVIAGPLWGDPGRWYPLRTRRAGEVLVAKIVWSTAKNTSVGWDINTVTSIGNMFTLGSVGTIYAQDTLVGPAVGTAIADVTYKFCVVVRVAGFYFFMDSAGSGWKLVWKSSVSTASPLYPAIQNYDGAWSADYIRVPARLWLPPVLAHDTFTRGDGALGSTEPAGPDNQGAPILAWTGATWTILTNKAINTPTLGDELSTGNLVIGTWYSITACQVNYFYVGCAIGDTFRATAATALDANNKVKAITLTSLFATLPDVGTPDVVIDATLAAYTSPTQMGIVARLDSAVAPANFIIANQDGANVKITECVAGVYTSLASVASASAVSDVLRLDLSGANYRLYKVTSAGVATLISASTTNVLTGNLHGLFSTYSANTFSKFTVMQKAGYSIPD